MAARFGVALRRHGTVAAREFEELAQQARRHRGNRIDAQYRRARRADHLVGDAEQALVAAAEERPDDRELAEHVVEAVERNEGAAHADLVAMVVDMPTDRAADGGVLEQPVANGEAAERAGEIDPQVRELDPRRWAAGLLRGGSDALERRFSAHHEAADVENAVLRREIGALRIERDPHFAAADLGVDVVEAEEGAGVVGLDDDKLAAVGPACAQLADDRRIASELGVQREAGDDSAATRDPQIEAAQRLAVKAQDRAEFDVDIDILVLLLLVAARAGQRRFDEAASVINIAAHGHAQRAIGAPFRFEGSLVPVRKGKDREICGDDVPGGIDLDGAFDRSAGGFDHQIFEPRPRRLVDEGEGRATGATRRLQPSRQQIVDLGRREIGLDGKAALAPVRHASAELDRHRPGEGAAEIETEFAARVLVERGLDADIGVAVARLAVIERGSNAVDLDVTPDPVTQVVGGHLEQRGLDLLAHDH